MATLEINPADASGELSVENTYLDGVHGAMFSLRVAMNQLREEKAVNITEDDFKKLFNRAVELHDEAFSNLMLSQLLTVCPYTQEAN